mgnify:CR=1 FL=1|jgi:hypothetical protein|tara:strand:+ start:476 stop:1009 length:534 start_codon:yes stop_codon:yes gene_type:complete
MQRPRETPDRSGDVPLDELVNEGRVDLLQYTPNDSDGADMVTAMNRRKRVQRDNPRASTNHLNQTPVDLPDYVVRNPIKLEGYEWAYSTSTMPIENLRRVFIERNQLIELDIDSTLQWLSASKGSPKYDEVRGQLEQEAKMDNVNNQIILQLMYNRTEQGLPLLENTSNTLYSQSSQ